MKILVKGAYGETNFGDDLLMLVFEKYFNNEFKEDETVFSGQKSTYPSGLLVQSRYNEKIKPDVIVYGGGTQFFSFVEKKERSTVLSKLSRIIKDPSILYKYFRNKFVPKKEYSSEIISAFLGFGLGPFNNEEAKLIAKESMRNSLFVGVRDQVSFNYCSEWNIECVLGADVVFSSYFSLPPLEKTTNIKRKIGVIVRDWKWEKSGASYIEKLKQFIGESGDEIEYQFIVFAPHVDKKWMLYLSDTDTLVWNPEIDDVTNFLNKLNTFDAFISARYHGAIIAAILGKPVICVEIEPKLSILCEQVPELKLWKKPFDITSLKSLISTIDYDVDYSGSLTERGEKADSMLKLFKEQALAIIYKSL